MDRHNIKRYAKRPNAGRQKKLTYPAPGKKIFEKLLLILLFFCVVWGVIGFIRSDFFHITAIEFSGNIYTTEAEIRGALQVAEGVNIWKINTQLMAERVEGIPRVAETQIRRKLPGTIEVIITEKDMLALVPYQEYLLVLGTDGQIIGATTEPHKYHLPMLTGIVPRDLSVGDYPLETEQVLLIAEVIQALSAADVPVSEINLADQNNVVVITMNGLMAYLGAGGFREKANLLAQIKGRLVGRQGDGFLDLRAPSAPAFHVIERR